MAFVADNSVVVAWHFPSQATADTERALRLLQTQKAFAPPVWRLEFSHVLLKAVRNRRVTESAAFEIIAQQNALNFVVNEFAAAPEDLLKLAIQHQLSSYDASYLELALRLQLPLATKDDALRAGARSSGIALI